MKFNYDIIKSNIDLYDEYKKEYTIIEDFENGNVTIQSMRLVGLDDFAEFHRFISSQKNLGFDPILDINWKELKELLLLNQPDGKLKTYLSNRTQPQFKLLLLNGEKYDKLLNGRWHTKPKYRKNGYLGYGRRSQEKLFSLNTCAIPLMNWLIKTQTDVYENGNDFYKHFVDQYPQLKWYFKSINCDRIPKREIEVSNNLLKSFLELMSESNIDFRKLNCDFISNNLLDKIKSLMSIPNGTNIKCLVNKNNTSRESLLTKDKVYKVESTSIEKGFLKVLIINDRNIRQYYKYSYFEDMSVLRENLINDILD